jgi:transcriptional regulator with XRE-family HTH domain
MKDKEIFQVGKRIKVIRQQKDYKLIDVAMKANISKGLLSKIENGRTVPSLPVLFEIISAIGENPASFFEGIQQHSIAPLYFHIRETDYQAIEKEDSVGFHYFSIISQLFTDVTFNATLLKLDPQAKREMVTTDGMEFIYLIEGNIDYCLGDECLSMCQGDSLFFDGRVPHVKMNNTTHTAKILVIYLLFNSKL